MLRFRSKSLGQLPITHEIAQWSFNKAFVFLLSTNQILYQFSIPTLNEVKRIELKYFPSTIFCDELYLCIGFNDGSIEVRDPGSLDLIKSVDVTDLKGPGRKRILQFSSTNHHLFSNSDENGLIVFRKPSMLSYKWLLIDGETEFSSFSIHQNQIFVLSPLGEIYFLDFNVQRLIEIDPFILSLKYIDLEFDGIYLYLVTDRMIKIHNMKESFLVVNSIKTSFKIYHLLKIGRSIGVISSDGFLFVIKDLTQLISMEYQVDNQCHSSMIWKYKWNSISKDDPTYYEIKSGGYLFEISESK